MDYNNQNTDFNNQNTEFNNQYTGSTEGYTTYTGTGSTSPVIENRNKGMGVVGAILGALLGGVLWTIIGCLGYVSGWITIFIFFFAQFGYNKLSGAPKGAETDKFGVIISAVMGLLVIIPATYVSYGFALWKDLNTVGSFPFMEVLRDMPFYMDRYELWGEFGRNLALGYLFTGIAAVYMLVAALSSKRGKKKK